MWFDGPLILSGAIATGGAILAARAAGADLAYVGSPFIATDEANASDDYKQGVVDSGAADIIYSDLFTGVHGNYLRSSIERAGLDPDALAAGNLDTMKFGAEGSGKTKAWRDIWGSGQGIGVVDRSRQLQHGRVEVRGPQIVLGGARWQVMAPLRRIHRDLGPPKTCLTRPRLLVHPL